MTKKSEVKDQSFTANFTVEVTKAEEVGDRGKVTALVSVYDLPYSMGFMAKHQVEFGAFAESLAGNANVPLFWQHNWASSEQPPIGVGTGSESARGLLIEGEFFLDTEAGRSVFNAMKAGALREWSIGYRISEYVVEEQADEDFIIVHVKKAELLEASSVLRGANPATETLKVASEADVLSKLAELMEQVAKLTEQVDEDHETLSTRIADLETVVPAPGEVGGAIAKQSGDMCVEGDCKNEATTSRPTDDPDITETVCDEHAASSGEEPVEPATSEGGERPASEVASEPAPRVPDALPPLPDGQEPVGASTEDVGSLTRVLRCMNQANAAWAREQAEIDARVEQMKSTPA